VSDNRRLRRIFVHKRNEVTRGWEKFHNEELHGLYFSPNIRMNQSRRIILPGHVARMGHIENVYKIMVRKLEGKRQLGRSRRRWENNINVDLEEIERKDVS
jgi:hypothetical protein